MKLDNGFRKLPEFVDVFEAAQHALDTVKKEREEGIVGRATFGGPMHPCPSGFSEYMIKEYNIHYFYVAGCETTYNIEVWASVYNAIMSHYTHTGCSMRWLLSSWWLEKTGSRQPYDKDFPRDKVLPE